MFPGFRPSMSNQEKAMPPTTCPACAAVVPEDSATCPQCGKSLRAKTAPIRHAGGKLQAVATVLIATGIIATVTGAWWGPSLLFPGVVVFFLGRFV